jgi:hypothetical protein
MFRRLIFDHWVSLFPLISFIVASIIYAGIFRGALRMRRDQVDALSALPLQDETPSARRHDA